MRNSCLSILLPAVALLLSYPALASVPTVTQIVRDGDIEIETFIYGKGADTLIIAAGNGRPAAQLDALAQNIAARGVRVVTYNYRTIGASKGRIDGATLHDFAGDVWRIANAMGLEKVHLGGKTFGNRVMRSAAADKPKRTQSIVLIGAGGDILPSEEIQAMYRRYIDPKTSREEWLSLQAKLMFAPENEHLASRSGAIGSYPELAAAQIKASNATPKHEWEQGGTAPMLVLTCLEDRVAVPQNGLNLAKSRPGTWLVGMPGCAHNMIYERPEDISQLILDFIGKNSVNDR
jgi:pimeloyl-ACP methyl ester carboxylesterase